MKAFQTVGKAKIHLFADDHPPPHYHIIIEDQKVMVEIGTNRVMRPDRLSKKTEKLIAEALEWGLENQEALRARFTELNRRRR